MTPRQRALAIAAWWLLLGALGWLVQQRLVVSSDLRSFMPPAQNADQKLLLDEIGSGPASRLLLLAISDVPVDRAAQLSRALTARLRADAQFATVLDGEADLASLDPTWLPYRYLLSPTLDTQPLDRAYLAEQLQQRVEDLAAPGAQQLEDLLPRDPTLEVMKLAQRWTPAKAPLLHDGVWVSAQGEALLLAETRGAGFDTAAQSAAVDAAQRAFDALPDRGTARLTLSGPGYIGVQVAAATRSEAEHLSALGTVGFLLLLLIAYRNVGVLALTALPIASGALIGIGALALVYGSVHGITLAFGFTLLGVAQEYPIRLFSHRRADADAATSAAGVWPLLRLAIVSACIAYLAFFASGVLGLQQLALFTIVGLLIAGAATRWLLPPLLPGTYRDVASSPALARLQTRLARMPRPRWLPWAVLALALAMLGLAPTPLWQNDLAALTPVPAKLLAREGELRGALGAPDVRYLIVLEADDDQALLRASARVETAAADWIRRGLVDDVELPSRWLPDIATQRARQAKLPLPETLRADVEAAAAPLPFEAGTFAPFVDDVAAARTLAPLTPADFARTPFGARLGAMLAERDGRHLALGTLSGVHDADALAAGVAALGAGIRLLDLKAASEDLVARYRTRILQALGAALLLLALTVAAVFRDARRAWHVIAPMSLATLLALALLRAGGTSLSLFHLVALTLAAGLGLHYALFFERRVDDAAEARRTLHATLVCVISALLVFGLLATSTVPVLRAIGLTVALGVAFHFCLSTQMAQARAEDPHAHD